MADIATEDAAEPDEAPESQDSAQPGGERERSGTRYPAYSLEDCEKFVKRVHEIGGNEILEDELLKHLQLSKTTKSWVYKLSTARDFGLLDRRGRKNDARIAVTDLAKRLLLPGDEVELAASRQAAFLKPQLYDKLVAHYRGAPVPQTKYLAGLLVREHKIVESVADQAAEAFIASAKFAGFVHENVLGDPKPGARRKEEPPADSAGSQRTESGNAAQRGQAFQIPEGFIAHTFPLRRDLTVTIPLPIAITKKDVDRLHKWMDTLIIDEDES